MPKSAEALVKLITIDYPDIPPTVAQNIVQIYLSDPKQFKKSVEDMKAHVFDKLQDDVIDINNMQIIKPGTEEYDRVMQEKFKPPENIQSTDELPQSATISVDDASGEGHALSIEAPDSGEAAVLQGDAQE